MYSTLLVICNPVLHLMSAVLPGCEAAEAMLQGRLRQTCRHMQTHVTILCSLTACGDAVLGHLQHSYEGASVLRQPFKEKLPGTSKHAGLDNKA